MNNNTGTGSTGYAFIENSRGNILIEDSRFYDNDFKGFNTNAITASGSITINNSQFRQNGKQNQLFDSGVTINNSEFSNSGYIAHDQVSANNSVFYGSSKFIEANCTNCIIMGTTWGTSFNDSGIIKNSIIIGSTFLSDNDSNWSNNYNVIIIALDYQPLLVSTVWHAK